MRKLSTMSCACIRSRRGGERMRTRLLHPNFVTKLSARTSEITLVEEVLHSVVVLATLHVLGLVWCRASDDD